MNLPIASHLIYEVYPEVLADWFSHQPIEEQAIFLSQYMDSLSHDQMDDMSKSFTNHSLCGYHTAKNLEEFAARAKQSDCKTAMFSIIKIMAIIKS